ncbi:MAG: hypothetical protein FJ387_15295 [Verrucomicrobia bacterium]|nr:hypothetical protein [Verrucomicrobiota bacterium]
MKHTSVFFALRVERTLAGRLMGGGLGSLALGLALIVAPGVLGQVDTFADGDDTANPAWTHNSGYVNSTGQSWTVAEAVYRLQAPNNGLQTYGYIGSFVGEPYTDVRVSMDFVSFLSPGGAFGVGARLNSVNTFGNLNGYGYAYEPFADSGRGEVVLYRINNGVSLTDIGSEKVTLDPAKDYTFVLEVVGSTLHGQVFEVGGGLVAEKWATDATYASGVSGVFGYSQNPLPASDFSVDNVQVSAIPEAHTGLLLGLGVWALWAAVRRTR